MSDMPVDAFHYTNGFLAVFNADGEQIPELQGVVGREELIAFERRHPECRVLRNFHWDRTVWLDPETNRMHPRKPEATE